MSSYYSGGNAPNNNGGGTTGTGGNNWHANHAPYSYQTQGNFSNEYYGTNQYHDHYSHYTKYHDYYSAQQAAAAAASAIYQGSPATCPTKADSPVEQIKEQGQNLSDTKEPVRETAKDKSSPFNNSSPESNESDTNNKSNPPPVSGPLPFPPYGSSPAAAATAGTIHPGSTDPGSLAAMQAAAGFEMYASLAAGKAANHSSYYPWMKNYPGRIYSSSVAMLVHHTLGSLMALTPKALTQMFPHKHFL